MNRRSRNFSAAARLSPRGQRWRAACEPAAARSNCPSPGGSDPAATCFDGQWQCGERGQLGSGCYPDGGIAPPPDAGTCPLATLSPPLACSGDATCTPYSGHCAFDALTGQGECECGLPTPDSGADACVLDCYGDYCSLPSFTITCSGPGDTTCEQYVATCVATGESGAPYICECLAQDPPHNAADASSNGL